MRGKLSCFVSLGVIYYSEPNAEENPHSRTPPLRTCSGERFRGDSKTRLLRMDAVLGKGERYPRRPRTPLFLQLAFAICLRSRR